MTKRYTAMLAVLAGMFIATSASAEVYELRTYTCNEGKLELLKARFRDHTVKLFKKHGMKSVGYWVPTTEPKSKNTLIYILKHKSREAAKKSWGAFLKDPDWRKVAKESQKDGKFLCKRPDSVYMNKTDYSPKIKDGKKGDETLFEMRIYRCKPDMLHKVLDARFKAGTMKVFKKNGIHSVGYWHPCDEPDSKDTLVYILQHENAEKKAANWKAFGADPEWKEVRAKFARPLRAKPEVTFMKATDFSAIK